MALGSTNPSCFLGKLPNSLWIQTATAGGLWGARNPRVSLGTLGKTYGFKRLLREGSGEHETLVFEFLPNSQRGGSGVARVRSL